jgi:predicted transcriptional regulator
MSKRNRLDGRENTAKDCSLARQGNRRRLARTTSQGHAGCVSEGVPSNDGILTLEKLTTKERKMLDIEVALLPIHPQYAEAILTGKKIYEFRRKLFKRQVTHIALYATAPIKQIVGYAEVVDLHYDKPLILWGKCGDWGQIAYTDFTKYYAGLRVGVAIELCRPKRIKPIALKDIGITTALQGFRYIPSEVIGL